MLAERRRDVSTILVWVVIIFALCWSFFPFYWAIITSFKPPGVIMTKPSLVPFLQFEPTLFNWRNEYVTRGREITAALINSFVIAGGATLVAVCRRLQPRGCQASCPCRPRAFWPRPIRRPPSSTG